MRPLPSPPKTSSACTANEVLADALSDTDTDLSDVPDNLSESSQAMESVQSTKEAQKEQGSAAEGGASSTGPTASVLQGSAAAAHHSTQTPATPSSSQEVAAASQIPQPATPTTPQAAAAPTLPGLPTPGSTAGAPTTASTASTTATPPTLCRSTRSKHALVHWEDYDFSAWQTPSPPEPEVEPEVDHEDEPTMTSKIVILKTPSEVLRGFEQAEIAIAEESIGPLATKRKRKLEAPESSARKKSQNAEDRVQANPAQHSPFSSSIEDTPTPSSKRAPTGLKPARKARTQKTPRTPKTPKAKAAKVKRKIRLLDEEPPHYPAPDEEVVLAVPLKDGADSSLWEVASQLKTASPFGGKKPEPSGEPPIWSRRRTELCETLPYFRAFQGGVHTSDGYSYGHLFSNNAHERDYIDASVTVSCAGGSKEKDKDGNMVQVSDQEETGKVASLQNNMTDHRPAVHLVSNKCPMLPSQAPHEFNVLGHYKVTHIWQEMKWEDGKLVRFIRERWEKMNSGGEEIWWQPKGTTEIAERGSLPPPVTHTCEFCNTPWEQRYLQGWICMNVDCDAHWKLVTTSGELRDPDEAKLTYDPRFLKQKTEPWSNENHVFNLFPLNVQFAPDSSAHSLYSRHAWKGIVCPECKCCISRMTMTGWICDTSGCGYERISPRKAIPATTMREIYHNITNSYARSRDAILNADIIQEKPIYAYNYCVMVYRFPGVDGFVAHLIPNETVLTEVRGPDDMFNDLQMGEVPVKRHFVGNIGPAANYTRHMSVNYGMIYKFVAANINKNISFEDAPECVRQARSRLKWSMELVFALTSGKPMEEVREEFTDEQFNELLVLGYLEDQDINYHDDGEPGLGPTIATLSLGEPGSFKLRMKRDPWNGCTEKLEYDFKHTPLPMAHKYEQRIARHDEIVRNVPKDSPRGTKKAYLQKQAKAVGLTKGSDCKPMMDLTLGHGDVVIMHGAELQKSFEHSVDHEGLLRFAMTCRYINPLEAQKKIKLPYTVGPDPVHYDGCKLRIPRDGDGNPIGDPFGVWQPENPNGADGEMD